MARMIDVAGQAFGISSIWISDNGKFEFTIREDPNVVRSGPTLQEAEAFVAVVRQIIDDHKKHKS